jgi:hypothetical protein
VNDADAVKYTQLRFQPEGILQKTMKTMDKAAKTMKTMDKASNAARL